MSLRSAESRCTYDVGDVLARCLYVARGFHASFYFTIFAVHLTGTKLSCEEGMCGSCTVAVAKYDAQLKKPMYG